MEEAIEAESDDVTNYDLNSSEVIENFLALIKNCRSIAGAFNRATQLNELLKSKQSEMNLPINCLIQEVEHRWNSMFLMVLRIFEQANVKYYSFIKIIIFCLILFIKKGIECSF